MLSFNEWLIQLRRCFHQIPELSYREEKTASKIAEVLKDLGIPFETGVGKTGVVASLSAKRPGPVVAMRADMDALPLTEQNDVPYKSTHPGIMHACGHDGHVAMALGTARSLLEEKWPETGRGKILFFFQPAEEGGAGAQAMIETGIFDREPIEAIFAAHMHPELPAGRIGIARGVCHAASDSIRIRLTGDGGHGAHPHLCTDPLVAGAYLVTQLQTIVSRSISPTESAVVTIGRFHAGTASNIIPHEAILHGTVRTLKPAVRDKILSRIDDLLNGLEKAHQVRAELKITPGYPLLENDLALVDYVRECAGELLGKDCVHEGSPRMGAEDFAYFLQKCPGVMIRLGCHDPEKGFQYGLHSPFFDFDERALDVGVRLFTRLLSRYERRRPSEVITSYA